MILPRLLPGLLAGGMLLAASVGPPGPAAATEGDTPPLLSALGDQLRTVRVARFRFHERKYLRALERTLELEGTMVFSRDVGLYRRVTSPSEEEQLISADGTLIQRRADGTLERRPLEGTPAGRYFRGLYGLFAGDFRELDRLGTIVPEGNPADWRLRIDPGDTPPQSRFPTLVLEGRGSAVRRMTLLQNNGDSSVVHLSPVDVNEPLPPDQKRRLQALLDGD